MITKDFKKCPVCGVKGSECQVTFCHGWSKEDGLIKCEGETTQRIMTEDEIQFWVEQDGFVARD